jgi:hypothetical protein
MAKAAAKVTKKAAAPKKTKVRAPPVAPPPLPASPACAHTGLGRAPPPQRTNAQRRAPAPALPPPLPRQAPKVKGEAKEKRAPSPYIVFSKEQRPLIVSA